METSVQSIIIVNNAMGPQIVLPFFRPISIYEIEDNYDELKTEIKAVTQDELQKEIIGFLDAFKESLEVKNAEPLFNYFLFNHSGSIDASQIQDVFSALNDFITHATDDARPMH